MPITAIKGGFISPKVDPIKNRRYKKLTIVGGIGTIPEDAAYSPVSLVVGGKTWTNRAGAGDTSPQTVENLDSTKTYLLINSLGKNVIVDTVDTATPKKLTGATSYAFEWTEGKIALYELSATEAALTEAELGARYHYVDGTKSTISASRLKSVGKNLFDGRTFSRVGNTNVYLEFVTSAVVKIKPNTTYTIKRKTMSNRFYIMSGRFDNGINAKMSLVTNSVGLPTSVVHVDTVYSITTSSNDTHLNIYLSNEGYNPTFELQVEESTTTTPYEPYTESTLYLPNVGELRSLPNGTKDEIRVSGGKAELIKRVSDETNFLVEHISSESGIDLGNVYRFVISQISSKFNNILLSGANQTIDFQNISLPYVLGQYGGDFEHYYQDSEYLHIYILKSKLQDSTRQSLIDYLSDISATLTYQLANPQISKKHLYLDFGITNPIYAKKGDTIMWIPDGLPEESTVPEIEVEYGIGV